MNEGSAYRRKKIPNLQNKSMIFCSEACLTPCHHTKRYAAIRVSCSYFELLKSGVSFVMFRFFNGHIHHNKENMCIFATDLKSRSARE